MTDGNRRPPAPRTLKMGETAMDALRHLRTHTPHGVRLAALPFTAVFLVEGMTALFAPGNPGLALLGAAVALIAYTMFLVDWHRLMLLGSAQASPRLTPDSRDLRFFLRSLLVGVVVGVIVALPLVVFAPGLIAMPGGLYLFQIVASLLGLTGMLAAGGTLPATAIGKTCTLGDSWRATRAVLPTLLGLVFMIVAPLHLFGLSAQIAYHMAAQAGTFVVPALVVAQALTFLELAVFATLLSLVYRRRIQAHSGANGRGDATWEAGDDA